MEDENKHLVRLALFGMTLCVFSEVFELPEVFSLVVLKRSRSESLESENMERGTVLSKRPAEVACSER